MTGRFEVMSVPHGYAAEAQELADRLNIRAGGEVVVSINEMTLITGATCDLKGCREHFRLPEPLPWFEGWDEVRKIGEKHGWSLYAGRSRRLYCPKHGPSAGHAMLKLWPV